MEAQRKTGFFLKKCFFVGNLKTKPFFTKISLKMQFVIENSNFTIGNVLLL